MSRNHGNNKNKQNATVDCEHKDLLKISPKKIIKYYYNKIPLLKSSMGIKD